MNRIVAITVALSLLAGHAQGVQAKKKKKAKIKKMIIEIIIEILTGLITGSLLLAIEHLLSK